MAEGHRQRLKNRFLSEGLEGFEPHNVLELLLFFTVPRCDTNPIAHDLIDTFGSLSDVFDAEYEDLMQVNGIKEHSAALIKLIPAISRYYYMDRQQKRIDLSTNEKIGEYLISLYYGINVETVYLLLLDNKMHLIGRVKLHEGSVNSAAIDIRKIAERAFAKRAAHVILAHNHPNGIAVPSGDDLLTTQNVLRALKPLQIDFVNHFIVAEDKYAAIL